MKPVTTIPIALVSAVCFGSGIAMLTANWHGPRPVGIALGAGAAFLLLAWGLA